MSASPTLGAQRPALSRWARVLPVDLLLALRFLKEGRTQSLLILAGVTGGVAVIIFLTQLINQLQASIIDRVLGSQAHVVIRPLEDQTLPVLTTDDALSAATILQPREQRLRSLDEWEQIAALARTTQGVLDVSPMVSGPAFALRGSASKSVALLGVEPDAYARIVRMDERMVEGRFAFSGAQALIGIELARDLGVSVGDRIRLQTGNGRSEIVEIRGLFDMENRDLNRRWVFLTLRMAQTLLDLPGGVSSLDVTVTDIFSASEVAERLSSRTGLLAESWMQTNAGLLAALSNQSISNNLIRSFVIIIVALGISSVLVVSVVQKQREVGILRAMGASRGQMLRVFLYQGGLVGLIGSLLGSALAWTLLQVFSRVYQNAQGGSLFQPQLDPTLILMASAVALGVGVLAAVVPARRAARMDPVQAIRS